jgi:hypothetical protein
MSDPRPVRITDPEVDQWIEEHIPRGEFNFWANCVFKRAVRDEAVEETFETLQEKTDRRIFLFGMSMFLFMGIVFICYTINYLIGSTSFILQSLLSIMFLIAAGMIFIYVFLSMKQHREAA